ncbi:MAG: cell envelope integrity protein TolA [Dysgonamonadaceae bacterium]|jgi:tetratricopeptide (TPR) repeat protein|nr:cell envelope integrity protein TolA [Dysgonamonadaceae bacterium]
MLKYKPAFALLLLPVLLSSCSSTKNTGATRWYHSFNTRYNVYFNGDMAYREALKAQQEGYQENYSETILLFPVSALPKDKENPGGPFDRAIEKGVKAIKTHSIQTKPDRQAGKRNDPKYREWMNRKEYNPFLHNAWMLLAKAQFHNGDFLQAGSSFAYISRLYGTQPEIAADAKLWLARCYSEIGWFYEADDIFTKLEREGIPARLQKWHETVYADYLIKQKRYAEAVPYLRTAIRAEKDKLQKNREKYLLGQLYSLLGQREPAYKTFGEVAAASIAYPLAFSARIRQTEVYAGKDTAKIIKQLRKMAKSSKNKDFLDQIYYALGNIYLSVPDTAQAIAGYELGVEKSVRQGRDKALNEIRLGDIYFEQRRFIQAQPNYAGALPQLKKEDEAYPRVSKRSEVLDGLVVHVEAVELQDSLQRLARMSEDDRLAVINQIIADLVKAEEEEKKKQEREDYLSQQEDLRSQLNTNRPGPKSAQGVVAPPGEDNAFYFYNPQVVAIGKNAFQQKWGRRKLEDDWRRRNKSNPMGDVLTEEPESGELPETGEETAAVDEPEAPTEASSDPHDPAFYLQQIPLTEEDLEASNLIIADGLYNMAVIYKDELEDIPLSLETFDSLNTRFPEHENKLMSYYHLYLIYLKEGNREMAEQYKQKIRTEFAGSEYAVAMADPDYEYNLKMMDVIQDSLYQDTYHAYLNGDVEKIRRNYRSMTTRYSLSKLMPKFMFLNALSYVQQNDANGFKEQLKELISKYPEADVALLAAEMMKGFQRGLLLAASGDNMLARGSLFNIRLGLEGGDAAATDELPFSPETDTPYVLLIIYPQGTLNENLLLYTVASFNFGNFIINDFDLEKTTVSGIGILQVKNFNHFAEILQYIQIIHGPEGYAPELEQSAIIVPISEANYAILTRGKSLEEYMLFFEEHFGAENQNLVERWKLKQAQELEAVQEEPEPAAETPSPSPEPSPEASPESAPEPEESPAETVVPEPDAAAQDSAAVHPPTLEELERQRIERRMEELQQQTDDLLDRGSGIIDDATQTINEIANDPIRGIQKLFKRKKSSNAIDEYAKEQEKAEKERLKQLKKERQAEEQRAKELLRQEKAAEKAQAAEKEDDRKQKEDARKQKEKDRKQKEKDRKEKAKAREAERKQKDKARKEAQKARDKARKEAQKAKEDARKAKRNSRN